jgi:dTDP-4-amino-4,6-dideoxygalactose transaminase
MPQKKIPMLDLSRHFALYWPEISSRIEAIFRRGQFILGKEVRYFEEDFAAYLGVPYVLSCASGTDALVLALRALDIGPGDEVIVPDFTFAATAEAVALVGATPVFVDVDPIHALLDPSGLDHALSHRTKAIIPVHLYGQAADLFSIMDFSKKHGLHVIEDSAQASGAMFAGKKLGSFGTFGCFSFYPSKNLGAAGDGGAIATHDAALAEKVKMLRNHGSKGNYCHEAIGFNSRLDEIQAAVLNVLLPHLDEFNHKRRLVAAQYTEKLAALPCLLPTEQENAFHVYHQYTIQVSNRDEVRRSLGEHGISSMIYYPNPLSGQQAFKNGLAKENPNACALSQKVLSLPIFPEMQPEEIDRVVAALAHGFRSATLKTPF